MDFMIPGAQVLAACGAGVLAPKQEECSLPDCTAAVFEAWSTPGLEA
jgi:hypothetical protein